MSLNSLRDLDLAGVKWELADITNPAGKEVVSKTAPQTPTNSQDITHAEVAPTTIIPSFAPVALSAAQEIAGKITDLDNFLDTIRSFDHPLRQFAKQTVVPQFGQHPNGLLILTDAPGSDDETVGQILSGPAGDLMNKMLSAIDLDRSAVSIMPLIFWRTPGGRTPARDEIDLARPFVNRAIELLQPKAILTLGTLTASEWINEKLVKSHGEVFKDAADIPVIPIYHPNYMILKPETKRDVWQALQKLQILLKKCEE